MLLAVGQCYGKHFALAFRLLRTALVVQVISREVRFWGVANSIGVSRRFRVDDGPLGSNPLALHTRLRRGEIPRLRWADVDFRRMHWSIESQTRGPAIDILSCLAIDKLETFGSISDYALAFLGGFGLNATTSGFSAVISRFKAGTS
jgi:integrase